MGKRPSFQFYPADWRKDPELRACSVAARGLWVDMLCIMHEADPYGHLVVNGSPMDKKQLSRSCGEGVKSISRLLSELESAGVFSRVENGSLEGAIYSRRLVRDEHIRIVRAKAGAKGAEVTNAGRLPTDLPRQNSGKSSEPRARAPSSSSSSSASSKEAAAAAARAIDMNKLKVWGVDGDILDRFEAVADHPTWPSVVLRMLGPEGENHELFHGRPPDQYPGLVSRALSDMADDAKQFTRKRFLGFVKTLAVNPEPASEPGAAPDDESPSERYARSHPEEHARILAWLEGHAWWADTGDATKSEQLDQAIRDYCDGKLKLPAASAA